MRQDLTQTRSTMNLIFSQSCSWTPNPPASNSQCWDCWSVPPCQLCKKGDLFVINPDIIGSILICLFVGTGSLLFALCFVVFLLYICIHILIYTFIFLMCPHIWLCIINSYRQLLFKIINYNNVKQLFYLSGFNLSLIKDGTKGILFLFSAFNKVLLVKYW